MNPFNLVMWVFALVLFVLAALPWAQVAPYWSRLIGAGLACIAAAQIFGLAGPLFK